MDGWKMRNMREDNAAEKEFNGMIEGNQTRWGGGAGGVGVEKQKEIESLLFLPESEQMDRPAFSVGFIAMSLLGLLDVCGYRSVSLS